MNKKKIGKYILWAVSLLLVACTETDIEPKPEPTPELRVNLQITRQDEMTTRATVKSAWEDGDVVFVFFKGVAFPKYLEMKYNGSQWVATAKNCLTTDDLTGATDKRMTAICLPLGNDATVQDNGSFNAAYSGFFLQTELVNYTYTDALNGTLNMVAPTLAGGEKHIHFDVSSYTAAHSYNLYQESVRPIVCTGVSSEGIVQWSEGTAGNAITGHETGSVLSFSGALSSAAVGTATEYQFSIDDATASKLYTRNAGSKIISTSTAIGLGSLTDGSKWNANEYVDLGITVGGKRVMWATKNLGASSSTDAGLYYAFSETIGYAAGSGHDFNVTPDLSGKVASDILLPAYDAAHQAWKGLWRMPTLADIDALAALSHSFSNSGMTFTGNEKSIFLPAAGFYNRTTLNSNGSYGCYWTSKKFDDDSAYFLGFSYSNDIIRSYGETNGLYPGDNTDTYCGQPIRPVFSITHN